MLDNFPRTNSQVHDLQESGILPDSLFCLSNNDENHGVRLRNNANNNLSNSIWVFTALMCHFNVLSSSEKAVWVEQGEHWQSSDQEDDEWTSRKADHWLVSARHYVLLRGSFLLKWIINAAFLCPCPNSSKQVEEESDVIAQLPEIKSSDEETKGISILWIGPIVVQRLSGVNLFHCFIFMLCVKTWHYLITVILVIPMAPRWMTVNCSCSSLSTSGS